MLGRSKMKIVRTIAGHIGLLMRFIVVRLRTKTPPKAPSKAPATT
jgi:hypothetical protein